MVDIHLQENSCVSLAGVATSITRLLSRQKGASRDKSVSRVCRDKGFATKNISVAASASDACGCTALDMLE